MEHNEEKLEIVAQEFKGYSVLVTEENKIYEIKYDYVAPECRSLGSFDLICLKIDVSKDLMQDMGLMDSIKPPFTVCADRLNKVIVQQAGWRGLLQAYLYGIISDKSMSEEDAKDKVKLRVLSDNVELRNKQEKNYNSCMDRYNAINNWAGGYGKVYDSVADLAKELNEEAKK